MREVVLISMLVVLFVAHFDACAQSIPDAQKAGESIFKPILQLIIKWVIPLLAVIAILYGVSAGFRGGNWLEAIIIVIFGLALAFVQPLVQQLFNIQL